MAPELITAKIPLITAARAGFKALARTHDARPEFERGSSSRILLALRFRVRSRVAREFASPPRPQNFPHIPCVYTARREIFPPRIRVSAGQRSENSLSLPSPPSPPPPLPRGA